MSKASEYAKLRLEGRFLLDGDVIAEITPEGILDLEEKILDANEALSLAKWIIEKFQD